MRNYKSGPSYDIYSTIVTGKEYIIRQNINCPLLPGLCFSGLPRLFLWNTICRPCSTEPASCCAWSPALKRLCPMVIFRHIRRERIILGDSNREKGNILGGPTTPYKSSLAALAAARTCIHHALKFPSNSRILSFRLSNDTREPTACLGAVQLEEERY